MTPNPRSCFSSDQYGLLRRSVMTAARTLSKEQVLDLADALHEELRMRRSYSPKTKQFSSSRGAGPYRDADRSWL